MLIFITIHVCRLANFSVSGFEDFRQLRLQSRFKPLFCPGQAKARPASGKRADRKLQAVGNAAQMPARVYPVTTAEKGLNEIAGLVASPAQWFAKA